MANKLLFSIEQRNHSDTALFPNELKIFLLSHPLFAFLCNKRNFSLNVSFLDFLLSVNVSF